MSEVWVMHDVMCSERMYVELKAENDTFKTVF